MSETDEQRAERYVSSFMGEGISATVYRERLVEMMRNFAVETRQPQAEPSDAQVEAAVNAWGDDRTATLDDWHPEKVQAMRAALRAAGSVR